MDVRHVVVAVYILILSQEEVVEGRYKRIRSLNLNLCKQPRIDVQSTVGVKIEAIPSSKVYIESFNRPFHNKQNLSLEFKTLSYNGTLFYMNRRNDAYDMVSGEIIDGFLEFKIRCKSSYANLRISRKRVDDGEWHTIQFRRVHRKGIFLLDGEDYLGRYFVGCRGFTSLNIGNTHPEHDISQTVRELKVRDGLMSACIRNLHLSTGIAAPPHYIAISECI